MKHGPRTRHRAVLTASAGLAAAGALLPANAFAAPTAPQAGPTTVTATASGQAAKGDGGHDGYRIRYCHWSQHGRLYGWGGWHCHTYWYEFGDGHGEGHRKDHWNGKGNDNWNWTWNSGWNGYADGRLSSRLPGV